MSLLSASAQGSDLQSSVSPPEDVALFSSRAPRFTGWKVPVQSDTGCLDSGLGVPGNSKQLSHLPAS